MQFEVEIDEAEFLEQMNADEIFEKANISEANCKDRFGDGLLDEWSIQDIIDYLGEEDFLGHISEADAMEFYKD